jgi:UDPglucose 6-dehydrogenase
MSFWNAEVAKIAVNSFVTMKMSFANTLADICERHSNGDVDKITRALGRDSRIGPSYLRGALGYGGPCFPRDNVAFIRFARTMGVTAELARATDKINKRQVRRVMSIIEEHCTFDSSIGILGVTYKPDTNVIEASQSLLLANGLARKGYEVHVYDPSIGPNYQHEFSSLQVEKAAEDCIKRSDFCIIATPWHEFSIIDSSKLANKTVLDCWRVIEDGNMINSRGYLALGRDMVSKRTSEVLQGSRKVSAGYG